MFKNEPIVCYQIRTYDTCDKLVKKRHALFYSSAFKFAFQEFNDRQICRAVIRYIRTELNDWFVEIVIDNMHMQWPTIDETKVQNWKITFYDAGDRIIDEKKLSKCPPVLGKRADLEQINALYCVVTATINKRNYIVSSESNSDHKYYKIGAELPKRAGRLAEQARREDRRENRRLGI